MPQHLLRLPRCYSTPSSRWKSVASERIMMIQRRHPVVHLAKNRSLKYRDLKRASPHPPSHCLPPSKQRTACNYLAFSPRLTLSSTFSSWHQCTAHYSTLSDHPPLLHVQPLFPSNANPNSCADPLDCAKAKDRALFHTPCGIHNSFIFILFVSATEICKTAS